MASMCKCFMAAIFSWGRRLHRANESWAQALRCQNVIQWESSSVSWLHFFWISFRSFFHEKKNIMISWIQRFDRISVIHRHTTPDSSPPGRYNLDNEMGSVAGSCLIITSRLWETMGQVCHQSTSSRRSTLSLRKLHAIVHVWDTDPPTGKPPTHTPQKNGRSTSSRLITWMLCFKHGNIACPSRASKVTEMTFHNPHPLYPTTVTSSCRSCWALTWRESLISFEFCWKQSMVEIVEVAPATLELLKLASSKFAKDKALLGDLAPTYLPSHHWCLRDMKWMITGKN